MPQEIDITKLEGYFGTIADIPNERDFELVGAVLNLPRAKHTFAENKIIYSQGEVNSFSCTLHAAIGALSDLTGVTLTLQERKDLWAEAVKLGADPTFGWYTAKAIDLVRKWWNAKYPAEELMSFKVTTGSEEFYDALQKGYSVSVAFNGNGVYNADKKDGKLDNFPTGKTTYGHNVRIVAGDKPDTYIMVVDNYAWTGLQNFYSIDRDLLEKMVFKTVFFSNSYLYVRKKDYDRINNPSPIPLWALAAVENAKKAGVIDDETDLDENVGTSGLENILFNAKIFTQREGKVSVLRLLVALDRMGIFKS